MKYCILTGEVKSITENDKGGLSFRLRNVHGDGKGSNLEFFDVYGKYAEAIREKKIVLVGDVISVSYEEKQIQIADPQTGKPDKWVTRKDNITIKRTYRPASGEASTAKPETAEDGFDYDTF